MKIFKQRKIITYTIFVIAVIFTLTACKDTDTDEPHDIFGDVDNSIFDEYIYRANNILSRELPVPVSGVLINEDDIVYWYADSTPEIVITTINEFGTVKQTTRIPAQGWRVAAHGLQITGENNIELIKVEDFETSDVVVTYAAYNQQGIELSAVDISGVIARGNQFVQIKQAIFTDDGNIAVVVDEFGPFDNVILLNKEGNLLGQLQINSVLNICKLKDGRIVALERERFIEGAGLSMREIDFESGDWGESIPLTVPNSTKLIPVGASQNFDLMINDGRFLYGYTIETHTQTHTQTPLLDWIEVGVIPTYDFHIGFLTDDRIIVLETQNTSTDEDEKWHTDFYILSCVSRDELPSKTVITLGGLFLDAGIRQEVISFNRENHEYQIELLNYSYSDLDKLRVEMITGGGPDIIMIHPNDPYNSEFFADFYPFIDADPIINREDKGTVPLSFYEHAVLKRFDSSIALQNASSSDIFVSKTLQSAAKSLIINMLFCPFGRAQGKRKNGAG